MKALTCARSSRLFRCMVAGLVLLSIGAFAGQVPSGEYEFVEAIPGSVLIWDFSEPTGYSWYVREDFEEVLLEEGIPWLWGDCEVPIRVLQDGKGKVTGIEDTKPCTAEPYSLSLTVYNLKGSVKNKRGVTTAKITFKFSGIANAVLPPFKGSVKLNLELDPFTRWLYGPANVKVSAQGMGSARWVDMWSVPVPEDMDGSFQLVSSVQSSNGKKLLGTGALMLSNGDVYDYAAKGAYNGKKELTTLVLKGSDEASKGMMVKMKASGQDLTVDLLKLKALGQKIVMKVRDGAIGSLEPLE